MKESIKLTENRLQSSIFTILFNVGTDCGSLLEILVHLLSETL